MPPTRHRTPTASENAATAIPGLGPAPAIGITVAAIIGAIAESGAMTRIRDGPNTA